MRRAFLVLLAAVAGVLASEALYRSQSFRTPNALVRQNAVPDAATAHEVELLRDQFPDEASFEQALLSAGLSREELRAEVSKHIAELRSLEEQIAPQLNASADEVRRFYDSHPEIFLQPQRFRASHIFLAAPNGSAPEVIAAKQSEIEGIAVRLLAGEDFPALAAELSEDEATKTRGGDLGYFSAWRMPPEFIAELAKQKLGELSAPIRTHLGFHIVRLTEVKPARQLGLEEVHAEIRARLAKEKRRAAVAQLAAQTSRR